MGPHEEGIKYIWQSLCHHFLTLSMKKTIVRLTFIVCMLNVLLKEFCSAHDVHQRFYRNFKFSHTPMCFQPHFLSISAMSLGHHIFVCLYLFLLFILCLHFFQISTQPTFENVLVPKLRRTKSVMVSVKKKLKIQEQFYLLDISI